MRGQNPKMSEHPPKMSYRPEIDGMRAIAVTAVIIYHLKIPFGDGVFLPGGFLGVDLFFVLSGFLITQILLRELDATGRISFASFYARRARRIFPPLLLVMLVSIPFALHILLPSELTRFGLSLLANLTFLSNFFWAAELGSYGAQSSLLQPFLHTLSLAIEEQFYLVFPVVLLMLAKAKSQRAIWAGIVVLGLASLVAAQATTLVRADFSFFSPVSRAWELLAGSGTAYLVHKRVMVLRSGAVAKLLPALAIIVLFGYFWGFSLLHNVHPGLPTLPVVMASCALLYFTAKGEAVTAVLSAAPLVFVGKLSYSIYLWHFPVFAFGRLTNIDGVTPGDWALWTALTLALSIIGYYLVERPFRFRLSTRAFVSSTTAAVLAVAAFGIASSFSDVFSHNRLAKLDALYGDNTYDNEALTKRSWALLKSLNPDPEADPPGAHVASDHEQNMRWFARDSSHKLLVIGNSHSKDFFNAMSLNVARLGDVEVARFGIKNDFAPKRMASLFAAPNFVQADTIIIAPKYNPASMDRLRAFVQKTRAAGKAVIVVGNTAEFESPSTLPIFDWYLRRSNDPASLAQLNEVAYQYEIKQIARLNQEIKQIAQQSGATFLSRRDLVCNDTAGECVLITPEGKKALFDGHHWTVDGARYFGAVAVQRGWFAALAPD